MALIASLDTTYKKRERSSLFNLNISTVHIQKTPLLKLCVLFESAPLRPEIKSLKTEAASLYVFECVQKSIR